MLDLLSYSTARAVAMFALPFIRNGKNRHKKRAMLVTTASPSVTF
jgi:hypothetical protein